jgi:SAM-dependent methyltransferase
LIKENREKINQDLRDPDQRKFFSPATYAQYQATFPVISQYAHGKLIDIGCGDMPYKNIILNKVNRYDTIDVERRVPDVKFLGDIHNMDVLKDKSYDTAVCLEVLEHVQNPFKALEEIYRILRKDGYLILSVPHLSRLHEEPHDYFRYTKYGLRSSIENAGFKILSITPSGGLFCFLGHQFSTVFLCPFWHIPIIRQIFFFLNKWLCVKSCFFLDNIFDRDKIFALGYTVTAQKI